MSETSPTLHESSGLLRDQTVDLHRALVSLQEELQAVDWYRQRADACRDSALRDILEHNMNEEIEHSAMLLEWLRRNHPGFATQLDTYIRSEGPVTAAEEAADDDPGAGDGRQQHEIRCDNGEAASADTFTVGPMKETA